MTAARYRDDGIALPVQIGPAIFIYLSAPFHETQILAIYRALPRTQEHF